MLFLLRSIGDSMNYGQTGIHYGQFLTALSTYFTPWMRCFVIDWSGGRTMSSLLQFQVLSL